MLKMSLSSNQESTNLSYKQSKNQISSVLPMSFKGMILLEIWKKIRQKKAHFESLDCQSFCEKGKEVKKRKEQCLIRWKFECRKKEIISKTINCVLSQQTTSKSSFFYRLKKLIHEQQCKEIGILPIESLKSEIGLSSNKILISSISSPIEQTQVTPKSDIPQAKPIYRDASINTAPILEDIQECEIQNSQPVVQKEKVSKRQHKKVKIRVKDSLIERIEAQMGRQFKKLDKIIGKVNEIQSFDS